MSSEETTTHILDAAERLFAADGYAATSIRAITRAANVNVASIHYHFGSKEAVLRGVLARVAAPINERRNALFDALESPGVSELVEAFVRPDLEVLHELQRRDGHAARFIGRTYSDPSEPMASIAREQFLATGRRFVAQLQRALPHLPEEEIWWRLDQVVVVIVNTFVTYPEEGMSETEMERTIARLVAFLSAGLEAPPPRGVPSTHE